MKRILSTILAFILCAGIGMMLTGCEEKEEGAYSGYDLSEYIKLADYDAYEIEAAVPEKVTDAEIQKGIEQDLAYYGIKHQTTEGIARKGDTITISYKGTLEDGTTPEGMSAEEYTLTLGEGNMIEGFEEGLYNAEVGETVTVKATFPNPYIMNAELAGKDAEFEVKILSREYIDLPDLTNELIREAHEGYYQTVDEYMADVERYYEEQHAEEAYEAVTDELFARIVADTEVLKYPEENVDTEASYYIMKNMEYATNNQYEWEDYLKNALQMTNEEFEAAATAYGEEVVKREMVIYAMAEKEGLEITKEEYEAGMNDFLTNTAKMTAEEFATKMEMTIEEYAEEYDLERELLMEEALEVVYNRLISE